MNWSPWGHIRNDKEANFMNDSSKVTTSIFKEESKPDTNNILDQFKIRAPQRHESIFS